MKKILIVDDHPVLREGLVSVLQLDSRLAVAGVAGSSAEALSILEAVQADLVIADLGLPDQDGTGLAQSGIDRRVFVRNPARCDQRSAGRTDAPRRDVVL